MPPRWLFCRIVTDEGSVGWGEPVVEGRAQRVRAAVGELSDLLLGADPRRVEDLWQLMTKAAFYRGDAVFSSAVAGIDQALWDILGKRLPTRAEVAGVVDRLAAVRAAIGDGCDVAVDFHGRFSVAAACRVIPEPAPSHPLFVEEPVLPEYTDQLARVVGASPVPIACGERLYSRSDFRPALRAGIAVAQPDPSHAGGISEVRRIASLAEVHDALLAPHCPLGPIALAASLQAPGLGIEVDESEVRRADAVGHRWRPPLWRPPTARTPSGRPPEHPVRVVDRQNTHGGALDRAGVRALSLEVSHPE